MKKAGSHSPRPAVMAIALLACSYLDRDTNYKLASIFMIAVAVRWATAAFVDQFIQGKLLFTFAPTSATQAGWNLGTSVAGAGDLDHDGFADLLVGTPGYFDVGGGSGTVLLYSGRDGLLLYHFEDWNGTDPNARMMDRIQFWKNMGTVGAALFFAVYSGPDWPMSLGG